MIGLTTLGLVHTAISLVAVAAGIIAFIRDKEISGRNGIGQLYIWTTILTCLTGFPIMQHGGFGKPHVLGVITLLVLALAAITARGKWFGRASSYVSVVSFSATFFFHLIPALVETTTRLPVGAPLITNREGPEIQAGTGILFVLFVVGATLQVRRQYRRGGAKTIGIGLAEGLTLPR